MKKIDYKHGTFTILKSEIDTDDFDREDYEAYCEDNDIEVGDDEGFFDWCAEETQANYEADMENIESCKEYNVPVVVTGTLGLWWGHPEIKPERFVLTALTPTMFLWSSTMGLSPWIAIITMGLTASLSRHCPRKASPSSSRTTRSTTSSVCLTFTR